MAAKENGQTRKVVIKYEKAPDYREIPANGAWGGVTNQGEIHMHLFLELATLPITVTHEVSENRLGTETERDTGSTMITRNLQVGVTMTPRSARSIARWLMGKVEELEKLSQGASNADAN